MLGFGFAMADNQLFAKSLSEDDAVDEYLNLSP